MRWSVLLLAACSAPQTAAPGATATVWPPIVDSHVHLAYEPVGAELAKHGVGVGVDLAAPSAHSVSRRP
jgi:hypothetical protein